MKMDFSQAMGLLAVRHAQREALVNIERKRRYTFGELHRLTNRIVNMMRGRLQLRRNDIYLCILENDNLSLLHVWTAFKGEAAGAFTNFRDSMDEHLWQVDFIKPKVVFVENALLDRYFDRLRALGALVVCMDPPQAQRDGLLYFWDLLEGGRITIRPSRTRSPAMSCCIASPAGPPARASAPSTRWTTG